MGIKSGGRNGGIAVEELKANLVIPENTVPCPLCTVIGVVTGRTHQH